MTIHDLMNWLPYHGALILFLVNATACFGAPVPASLLMLAAGAVASTGRIDLGSLAFAGIMGAVFGDWCGYLLGRLAGARWIAAKGGQRIRNGVERAGAALARRGFWVIFLSRNVASPIGPWMNLACGIARHPFGRFATATALGDVLWVVVYLLIGTLVGRNYQRVAEIAGSAVGMATILAILGLGAWLLISYRARQKRMPDSPNGS